MKNFFAIVVLTAVLSMGTGVAKAGIITAGIADPTEPCTEKTDDLTGIITAGLTGIITAGFTGIITAGFTGIITAGAADVPSECGIITAG